MTFAEKLDKAVEEYRQELEGNGVKISFVAAKRFLLMAALDHMNEEPPLWAGLLATPEELATLEKEKPCDK